MKKQESEVRINNRFLLSAFCLPLSAQRLDLLTRPATAGRYYYLEDSFVCGRRRGGKDYNETGRTKPGGLEVHH
jgi:hypothetical protein